MANAFDGYLYRHLNFMVLDSCFLTKAFG